MVTLPWATRVSPNLRTSAVIGITGYLLRYVVALVRRAMVRRRGAAKMSVELRTCLRSRRCGGRDVRQVVCPVLRTAGVFSAERLVDLEQHLLLPFGDRGVTEDGSRDVGVGVALLEDPG